MKARIAEVFESVQGEGIYLGEKQVFVRFFGCNLNCKFCDTKLDRFMEYEPQELFREIKLYHNRFHSVSFTGGEPLLQKDFLKEILQLTREAGLRNYLETNGTLPHHLKEVIDCVDIVAMDIKLPSSSHMGYLWGLHRKFLEIAREKEVFLKITVCESTVFEDLLEAMLLIKEIDRAAILILQPNCYDEYDKIAEKLKGFRDILINENITACVIPQMHKVIGVK